MKLVNQKIYVTQVANSVMGWVRERACPVHKGAIKVLMIIACSVVKLVKLAWEELPQIVWLVIWDIIEMIITTAWNVIKNVQHAKEVWFLIAYH